MEHGINRLKSLLASDFLRETTAVILSSTDRKKILQQISSTVLWVAFLPKDFEQVTFEKNKVTLKNDLCQQLEFNISSYNWSN